MNASSEKSSADIQREIDADRQRIGARIDAIQERMSPGQLVDEVLAYAKGSGGAEYVSNLGTALKANPLPVALIGVSLAWLVAKQGTTTAASPTPAVEEAYPLYRAQGAIRRVGPPDEVDGERYSHFVDDAGTRFKALTDEVGNRAGNFIDATGRTYRGFADATGKQLSNISDDAGALLDASTGWASDTWQQIKDTAGAVAQKVSGTTSAVSVSASNVGASLQDQSAQLTATILRQFRDQPLVGGALAFAVGAAIGATLPHTAKEDEILGEAADSLKADVADQAAGMVEQGKNLASDAYGKVVSVASDLHDTAKDRVLSDMNEAKNQNPAT